MPRSDWTHAGDPAAVAIGKKLRAIREERGYNRELVAVLCGISSETIKNIEYGQSFARIDNLVRIAMALEVPVEDLLPQPYDSAFEPPLQIVAPPKRAKMPRPDGPKAAKPRRKAR